MKASEIEVGNIYIIRHHDGRFYRVKVLFAVTRTAWGSRSGLDRRMTHYKCEKLATGRMIEVKSAAKFRQLVARNVDPVAHVHNFSDGGVCSCAK